MRTVRRRLLASVLATACGALPLTVHAGSVFLNGVNVDGVTNQRFEKASVRIDEKGNVYIDAKGYTAKVVQNPASTPGTPPTQKYFLVTEQAPPGATDFDIDVYVNGRFLRKLHSGEDPVISEVTRFLSLGHNTVLFAAHKLGRSARRSISPRDTFRVMMGSGTVNGDDVTMDQPQVRFTRTAAEDRDVTQEFDLTTR